ncbi:MAG: holo-ACP synthase [Epsilonproteobacteria bacterium]|nr:holo-ACP synthase [Campylobacterota bacterium]
MIGIDIVAISRIESMIERFGNKALDRFLNEEEKKLIKFPTTAAGFWAAKEAASKALGVGISAECGFADIYISKNPKGAPQISFSDRVNSKFNIKNASLSISHDGGFAIAAVILSFYNHDEKK